MAKNHSSANSLQVPYFLIRRAAKKVTFIADLRTNMCVYTGPVCECVCVYTADTYDSRSHRSGHIYHEIQVKNHSYANSLQVPYFLIRRAAKKVTFITDLRTNMCVCECVCILPIHTIHAVIVLVIFIMKFRSKIIALRIASRCHISLFADQRKKLR